LFLVFATVLPLLTRRSSKKKVKCKPNYCNKYIIQQEHHSDPVQQ